MRRLLAPVCVALATLAASMPMRPGRIPGDRLIANLEAMLAKRPKEANRIEYLLGRAHYAMYAATYEGSWTKPGEVEYYPAREEIIQVSKSKPISRSRKAGGKTVIDSVEDEPLPSFPEFMGYVRPWDGHSEPKSTLSNLRHIEAAVRHLNKAIRLSPDAYSALPHLTLACVFESSSTLAGKVTLLPPYRDLKTKADFLREAGKEYLAAFDLSLENDLNPKTGDLSHLHTPRQIPLFGLQTLISYEAARSYLRVAPNGPRHGQVAVALAKFNKLPPSGIVTPLIFSLDHRASLAELLAPGKVVDFDLNGTGLPQRYSWVQPTTAFLVWDPEGAGVITSGRRLFGNATWWMLWSNAYEALDALDNNRDGWLTGSELKGLAIWVDRNQNGRAEPGEVTPLRATEIDGIATHDSERVGISLANFEGIRLRDGRLLPSYDWTTSPVKK